MAIPFDLIFEPNKSGVFAGSGVFALAICEGLDPVLHPSGELQVYLEAETGKSEDGHSELNRFSSSRSRVI